MEEQSNETEIWGKWTRQVMSLPCLSACIAGWPGQIKAPSQEDESSKAENGQNARDLAERQKSLVGT